ncbi:hypothetical protein [Nocardioides sp.]|uniref:hypothetical protein n=1 Tax=Nocardioides sp. TaxID=35761 RepID=UPI0035134F6A
MSIPAQRAAVVKALKAGGAKPRKGRLRLAAGELFWYLDTRVVGLGASATLALEVGCWTPDLPPEPEGGAVDCPLLFDVAVADPAADVRALLDRLRGIGDLDALGARLPELPGALVDAPLRELLRTSG